ncbi:thioredoxin domain-containing protein [Pedobacter hartonius]|uniref:Thioredoxin n=1 Tax=Pedobacter hartonius TaxID=425514 RepID=A0A1H3WJ79_9SPHI|nr:thioredoxin family protein [Pedobacter hartonius]SDZ87179.1 hypothetical protein SAMN05443550_101277 [Pedobacter hartonius]
MIQHNCSRDSILSIPEMREKYDTEYTAYIPGLEIAEQLKTLLENVQIIIVLGTWCADSRLQVPRFFKITDSTGIAEDSIQLICINETKKTEDGLTDLLNIVSVPTFIFMEGDKELGRIIESPTGTLENDMIEILTKK